MRTCEDPKTKPNPNLVLQYAALMSKHYKIFPNTELQSFIRTLNFRILLFYEYQILKFFPLLNSEFLNFQKNKERMSLIRDLLFCPF